MSLFWINALKNTFIMVSGIALLCSIISLPTTYLLVRYKTSGARIFYKLFTLPYIFPSYILAMAWIVLANPSVGWLNKFSPIHFNIYSLSGIIIVESSVLISLLFMNLKIAYEKVDPQLEQAARLCGSNAWQSFFYVTFPLVKKSYLSSLLTITLASLASFGVPAMLGPAGKIYVFTTALYSLIKTGTESSFNEAIKLTVMSLIPTLIIVLAVRKLEKSKTNILVNARRSISSFKNLSPSAHLMMILMLSFLTSVFVILPIATLFFASFQNSLSEISFSHLSLRAWIYVFNNLPQFWESLLHSFEVAIVSTLIVVFLSFTLSLLEKNAEKKQKTFLIKFFSLLETFFLFLYSTPDYTNYDSGAVAWVAARPTF
jgi:iron(III) transport system permease protein